MIRKSILFIILGILCYYMDIYLCEYTNNLHLHSFGYHLLLSLALNEIILLICIMNSSLNTNDTIILTKSVLFIDFGFKTSKLKKN